MSERDGYQPGVPCWVDTWQPDGTAAVDFYTRLFGWEAEEAAAHYVVCKLRGRDVAAIGSPAPEDAPVPAWRTHIWVEGADDTATKVLDAGGSIVVEPHDSLGGGRAALVADPAGAMFAVRQPGDHTGAQRVNEPGAWSMSQLNTDHPAGSKRFYGAVFGWETDTFDLGDAGEITLWRVPGYEGGEPGQPVSREVVATMGPLGGGEPPAEVAAHWSVDFWVDDADATAERAAELGGNVIVPPFDTQVGRTAVLADPQGAVFSVSRVGSPNQHTEAER